METINTLIEAQPITPMKIRSSGTRGSTSYTSLTGISEISRNSSHIVERTKKSKSNRDESIPQPGLLHFELEQVRSFRNQKGVSPDKAAYVVIRALTKAADSSVAGSARDLSFFKDVLDQATGINPANGQASETSNESVRARNSYDKSNLSLPQLVDLLGKSSSNIIQRQQDEIRCLRLAVKELVGAVLDDEERTPRHEGGFPDVIEFRSPAEEEEKTRSLAPDRSPAVVSIRSASSHSHDIVPQGNYTQESTEILSSKKSLDSNLSFQNVDNEGSAGRGECAQLEIPDDATQPLDLSTIALSVDGEQMVDGKTERGALDILKTPGDHTEHEEEPSPIKNTHNLSNCYQEQEGDQALHSIEAPSLPLAANESEAEESDMGSTETERSSLTDLTESAQQPSLLGFGRQDSGENESRPPSHHLGAKPTSEELAGEIVEDINQHAVDYGAMKESVAESQCSSHSDVSHSDEVDDDMLSAGHYFANLDLPEELTLDLSSPHLQHDSITDDDSDLLGFASQILEELLTRELPSLNQTDEEVGEQSLEGGHDTHVPANTCVGDNVDSDADGQSEHSAVLEQSSDSVSPGSPYPAESIDRKDRDGGPSTPSFLLNEKDEEIREESTDHEHIITNGTIGEEDTEAGHNQASVNTRPSSFEHVSTEESRGLESVEAGANVDIPAESSEGGCSSDDASKQASAINNHELPVANTSGPPASSRQSFGPDHTDNIENPLVFHKKRRRSRNFPMDKGDAHPDEPYRPPT
jgi:hypothetical protein